MYTRALVPLDGSKAAERVLPYARALAGSLAIPVELIGVIDVAALATHLPAERAQHIETLIDDSARRSGEYLERIAKTFIGARVTCTVVRGTAEEAIIEKGEADPGTIIAMATHGRSGIGRWLLGSVAEKILRGTTSPLLLIRATDQATTEGRAAFKSVVVPLDGSELAESVLPMVATLAKKLGLNVLLFRAYHIPYTVYAGSEGSYGIDFNELSAAARDEAREYLEKKIAEVKKLGVEQVGCAYTEGIGADEIIRVGRETVDSFIAMCSHGRSGVKRWVLGSVTETVVRHSDQPVLVARSG